MLAIASSAFANSQNFLIKALLGDNSESTLGRIAATRATTPGVRAYGAMLVTDHSKGRLEVLPLVKRYHVPATTALQPEGDAEQHKLAGLRGPAIDREFVRYMVKDHTDDIDNFRGELKSNDPANVRALARRTLPVLQKHLATAQSLQAKLDRGGR